MSESETEAQLPGMWNARFRPSISAEDAAVPRFLSRRDVMARRNSPKDSGVWGYQRISYGAMEATYSRTNLFFLPVGQQTPVHNSLIEHIITGLAGEVEWTIEGQSFVLGYLDQLFVPAQVLYTCRNIGMETAIALSILSPDKDGWPDDDGQVVYQKLP
jgi:quercetin dioxygenase-like cupin family protein